MEVIEKYKGRYTGEEIDDLLGRISSIEVRESDKHLELAFYNASTWKCKHNLGKKPSVTVVDSGGDMILADVQHISDNYLEVYFGMNATGRVILN